MEGRVSSDQDLKLGDTLRYYQRDSNAAKALLVRRLRCLAAYEAANRNLEKARSKNKDVHAVSEIVIFLCKYIRCLVHSFTRKSNIFERTQFMQPVEVQEVTLCLLNGRFRLYAMHANCTPPSFPPLSSSVYRVLSYPHTTPAGSANQNFWFS